MTAFRTSYERFREQISQSPRISLNLRSDRDRKAYLSRFNPQLKVWENYTGNGARQLHAFEGVAERFHGSRTAEALSSTCAILQPDIMNVALELGERAPQLPSPTRPFDAHSPIRQEAGAAPGVASMVSREVGRWQPLMLLLRPMAGFSAGNPYSMLQWQCRDKKRLGVNLYLDRRY